MGIGRSARFVSGSVGCGATTIASRPRKRVIGAATRPSDSASLATVRSTPALYRLPGNLHFARSAERHVERMHRHLSTIRRCSAKGNAIRNTEVLLAIMAILGERRAEPP